MKLLRTEAEMVQAYRDRIRELGLTHATVDAISGLPDGYTSKLMCDPPMKNIGAKSRELLNGALGIGFVVAKDPEQIKRVSGRWVRRERPLRGSLSMSLSIDNQVPVIMQITPELKEQLSPKERMIEGAKRGGKRRLKTMGKRARRHAAQFAARVRWNRVNGPRSPAATPSR